MKNPTPDPSPSRFEAMRSLFERARALPVAAREAFVRKEATDARMADEVLALLDRSDEEMTIWLQGGAAPTTAPGDRVQSTATDELLQKLKTAPKLDTHRFALEGELGKGGMGVVMKIHDQHLNRRLAMKVLIERGEPRDDEERRLVHQLLGRFLEEAQVTSQLDHPGVVPVHELGLDQAGRVYFTMRMVKGRTASEVFADAHAETNDWTVTRGLEVILRVCDTMGYAHEKGVLHRDLKPANVMVGRFGEVYVMDWGLAKVVGQADRHDLRIQKDAGTGASRLMTSRQKDADADVDSSVVSMDGQQLGTPSYMAPEQARSEALDVRADVYSIGAMLYELLTGRAPYDVPGLRQAARHILKEVVEGPCKRVEAVQKGVPAELVAIVDKAMAREREERYANPAALAKDLRAYLAQRTVSAYRTGALVEMRLWIRRNRALASSLAAALLLLVGGVVLGSFAVQQAEAAAQNRLFRDVQALADAKRDEESLYPAFPEMVPKMESWLRDQAQPLAARLPNWELQLNALEAKAKPSTAEQRQAKVANHSQRARLDRLRAEAEAESDPVRRSTLQSDIVALQHAIESAAFEFADDADQYRHRTMAQLVRELQVFVRDESIPGVVQRIAAAKVVHQQTVVAYQTKWDHAIADIAAADGARASADYAMFPPKLKPQLGLVPLRMDPESKLWEFVHLSSGTPGKEIPAIDPQTNRLVPTGDMGIVFVLIPGGTLPPGTKDDEGDRSVRLGVRLDAFFLSKYELTNGQWLRLTKNKPAFYRNSLALPISSVNWFDGETALRRQGLELPTELRWEYACRGKTSTLWWTGNDESSLAGMENIDVGPVNVLPVGSKQPNWFGLFDMGGNLREWCLDPFDSYGAEQHGDGRRPFSHEDHHRVVRGGDASNGPMAARSDSRGDTCWQTTTTDKACARPETHADPSPCSPRQPSQRAAGEHGRVAGGSRPASGLANRMRTGLPSPLPTCRRPRRCRVVAAASATSLAPEPRCSRRSA